MKPGPKPRVVSEKLLEEIEHHASRGLSQQQTCRTLGISEAWWYEAKKKNLEIMETYKTGEAKGLAEISNAVFEQALKGSTGAACFFLRIEIQIDGLM